MAFNKQLFSCALNVGVLSTTPAAAVQKQMEMAANAAATIRARCRISKARPASGHWRCRMKARQRRSSPVPSSVSTTPPSARRRKSSSSAPGSSTRDRRRPRSPAPGIAGFDTGADNVYISKSVTIAPDPTFQAQIYFRADDNGGEPFHPLVSLSCRIPPGVGINDTYVDYVFNDE